MRRHLTLLAVAVLVVLVVARVWAEPPRSAAEGFQGYWMGVDHVDGGDARRSLVQLDNGKFALAGRDTVLTLCDGTEHGFARFDDGELIGRDVMESNSLTITCFKNGATVVLHNRFELIGKGLMIEHTTRQDGSPVSSIVFHKVSQD